MRFRNCFEQVQIEHRLRDDIFGAGLRLPFHPADLFVHVQSARVGAHADQQRGLRSHGIAADVQAVVQIVDDVGEADGVDVEDRGGVRVSAHARRIAGDADQVADPDGVRAEQFRLDPENVAVAAAEVHHGFDAGLLLDELAGDLSAQPRAGARPVWHIDAIDAVRRAQLGACDFLGCIHAARRQDLDESDELPGRQLGSQLAFRRHRRFRQGLGLWRHRLFNGHA